jgi:chromosome partitioning protein
MSRAIALFNQAGGVGKSTLTMNHVYQASLTVFMGLEPSELDKTVYEAILIGEPMPIHQSLHNMDLAAVNINLRSQKFSVY